MSEPLWRPAPQRIAAANVTRFIDCVNARRSAEIADYAALYEWSVENPAEFWIELAHFADVRADWSTGLALVDGTRLPGAKWFPGARLNFAANLLRFRDSSEALVAVDARGNRRALTYQHLFGEVARVAQGLRAAGVVAGDRVAGLLPNVPEAAIAMLATASIGAIWSGCAPDDGIEQWLDHCRQIAPKVLFAVDGCDRGAGAPGILTQVRQRVPSVELIVGPAGADAVAFEQFGTAAHDIDFASLPFDQPLYITRTAHTSSVIHGAGGVLLQQQKEHLLHIDVRRGDRLLVNSACGSPQWHWLLSALAIGATLVQYDGAPDSPDASALWRLVDAEAITILSTDAIHLQTLQRAGEQPGLRHDLKTLRTILSTDPALPPPIYDYVYQYIKADLLLAAIAGLAEAAAGFWLSSPVLPVYRGELQTRGLALQTDVVDESGRPVRGQAGSLVCRAPFPSMPLGFWNDLDRTRYRSAYFERFDNAWYHGDLARTTEHDGIELLSQRA